MSKTLLGIPDELMAQAQSVPGTGATKIATVKAALELMIQPQRQQEAIDWVAETDPFISEEALAHEVPDEQGELVPSSPQSAPPAAGLRQDRYLADQSTWPIKAPAPDLRHPLNQLVDNTVGVDHLEVALIPGLGFDRRDDFDTLALQPLVLGIDRVDRERDK